MVNLQDFPKLFLTCENHKVIKGNQPLSSKAEGISRSMSLQSVLEFCRHLFDGSVEYDGSLGTSPILTLNFWLSSILPQSKHKGFGLSFLVSLIAFSLAVICKTGGREHL